MPRAMLSSHLTEEPKDLEPLEPNRQRLDRSPHPYYRQSLDLPDRIFEANKPAGARPRLPIGNASKEKSSELSTNSDSGSRERRGLTTSPSDSGTEADDERPLLRALTAPPLRPRKGLRGAQVSPSASPLLTPSNLDGTPPSYDLNAPQQQATEVSEAGRLGKVERTQRRRRYIILRRALETILLGLIGRLSFGSARFDYTHELYLHAVTLSAIYVFKFIRLLYHVAVQLSRTGLGPNMHVPFMKDPASLLYPTVIPVFIAVTVASENSLVVLANFVLGISAIPRKAIPFQADHIHWILSLVPFLYSQWILSSEAGSESAHRELLSLLFPLHRALTPSLEFLTTTSLLSTEIHLLSVGLINLLLFAKSPQGVIVKALLWIGGVTVYASCKDVLRWAVNLARVPSWRFRRVKHGIFRRSPILRAVDGLLGGWLSSKLESSIQKESSESEDDVPAPRKKLTTPRRQNSLDMSIDVNSAQRKSSYSAVIQNSRQRRYTLPTSPSALSDIPRLRQTASLGLQKLRDRPKTFQALTSAQAFLLKWIYAGYTYFIIFTTIFIPVRTYIGRYALNGYEPFGWALGYLFGGLPTFRLNVVLWHLERWIPLPLYDTSGSILPEPATMRLLIAAHIFSTLVFGLILVLKFATGAEVDTRRKLFHGMMVTMFLPTILIDPCFIALALSLALAVFLLLDLFRASQLPPLSRPLTIFLAPYVDGRDHRGPVVVSHIFLLIGCAVPLWLELAASSRTGEGAFYGWSVPGKGLGLIAGVVCVGMGDAAASLVGRRLGRRRWPWGGGKSLEGSLAFAVAVVVGLMGAKMWLELLAVWEGRESSPRFLSVLGKAAIAASGASFTEAVLTGANDNVLVPVVLWLLVRGLHL